MMWYAGHDWGCGGWLLMTLVLVLFLAVVITAAIVAVGYLAGPRGTAARPPGPGWTRAEGILAERFARGEIDHDEYLRRLALLRENR
jgi:putative membrane protein